MTLWLKQSTAKVVSFGPFLDRTDGVTEETGLVSALDHGTTGIKLSKNGGALTIRHATVTASTYDAYGMYLVTLDTTDTNTLGTLRMAFNEAATCLPVWQDFMVLPANIYDSIVSGSDLIDVSMTQILGTAVSSPATAGILDVNVKNIDNDAASASGTVTFPNATLASTTNITAAAGCAVSSIGANVITAASIAADAITDAKVASDVTIASVTGAVGSVTGAVGSVTGAVGSVTGNVGGNVTGSVGSVVGHTAQTGDAYARLGAPAGASVSADVAAIKAETATINTATGAAAIRTAVGLATANLDTQIATLATPTNITAATGIDITKILGTAISTPATAGILDVNVKNILNATANGGPTAGTLDVRLDDISVAGLTALSSAVIGRIATDGVDANSIKADAVTKIQTGLATPTNITGGVITTVTNLTNAPTAGDLTATMKASVTAAVPTAAAIADANWDEALSGHLTAGTTGKALSDAGAAGTPLDAAGVRAAIGLASANLDTQLAAIDDYLDTEVAAIKAKTDLIPAAPASTTNITAASGIAVSSIGANVITATSIASNAITSAKIATDAIGAAQLAADAVAEIVDANWDEALVGHSTFGSAGERLDNLYTLYLAGGSDGTVIASNFVAAPDAAGIRTAIGLASANLDTQLTAIDDYLDTEVAAIKAKTDLIPAAPASTTNITAAAGVTLAPTTGLGNQTADITGSLSGSVGSVTGTVGSVTGNIGGNVGGNVTGTVGSVVGAVGSVTGNVGGNVVGSVASVTGAVGSLTTNNDKTGYALTSAERNAVSDALLDRADAIATGITTRQGIQVILDVLAAKLSGAATATITVRDVADTKNVIVYTTDASGNRTAVTITP